MAAFKRSKPALEKKNVSSKRLGKDGLEHKLINASTEQTILLNLKHFNFSKPRDSLTLVQEPARASGRSSPPDCLLAPLMLCQFLSCYKGHSLVQAVTVPAVDRGLSLSPRGGPLSLSMPSPSWCLFQLQFDLQDVVFALSAKHAPLLILAETPLKQAL